MQNHHSFSEPRQQRMTNRGLVRKNSRVRHFKALVDQQQRIHTEVVQLTMRAISSNSVASMTPFITNKSQSIQRDIYTQAASCQTKPLFFSSSQSSELHSRRSGKKKSIFDRFMHIINCDRSRHVKRRKVKQNIKTDEDVLCQKYLSQSKQAQTSQKKIKKQIQDRMNKTMTDKSIFFLTNPKSYDILENTAVTSNQRTQASFHSTKVKPTRTSHFYSQTKKQIFSERYLDEEVTITPKKIQKETFTFIEYQGKQSAKNKFLNSKRRMKQYCPDLIKNQEKILTIAKQGTKNYQLLKRCLDSVVGRVG